MTGGESLVRCLTAEGVRVIFGMPGGHLECIYDALHRHQAEIRHVLVRNEQAASLMADGYARASGQPGVCLVIPGPGASNAATGIAEAMTASSPVLLITSQNERALAGKDKSRLFHGLDHVRFFSPITRLSRTVSAVEEIPTAIAEAFSILRSGRPGPVVLEVPKDILAAEGPIPEPVMTCPAPKMPEGETVSRAARRLAEASRPVLIAGGGVLFTNACDLLVELARRLKAPIVTTQTARGAVSDDDPLSLGDILDKAARTAIEEADLALALGCRFVHFDTASWSLKLPALIHVESERAYIGADFKTEIGIAADVRPTLEMFLDRLPQGDARAGWGDRIAALYSQREVEQRFPIVSVLRDTLPTEAIVVGDVHMTAYRMRRAFRVTAPRRYFASNSYCTLGYALPAALGAKAAFPDRPVVSVSGDGGFVMTCQELATAAQAGLSIAAVVVNDNCFTSIKGGQVRRFGGRCLAVDLRNPDFVALAAAFGLKGVRVSDDAGLSEAVRAALRAEATTLIELPIEKRF